MADIHENKTDSVEKKPDKSSERLAKDCPQANAAAHREALKANPNKRFTVSPEGSTGESFGLTEKGKLVASKHNSEKAFYDRSDSHDRKTSFTKNEVKDPSHQVEHNEKHQTFRVQDRNEISHLTGTLTSPDGKQSFSVAQGHVIDSHNKQIAQILADGTLKFPTDQSHKKQEDLNVAFRGFRFDGNENGLSRNFVATNQMADGKMFLPSENNRSAECIVRMGMIIDAHNGKQLGNIVEPPAYHGNKLDPGKIALVEDPSQAISLNNPRFKNAVFDLEIRGQVFDDHRRLQGVCTGDQQKPIIDLHVLADNQKKALDLKDRQFQDKMAENTIHALFGDNKPYEEHQAVSDNFIKSASTVNEILRTGHVDTTVLSKMDRDANTIIQAKVIAEQLSKSSFAIPPRPASEHKGANESKHFEKDHSKDQIKEKIAPKDLGAEKHLREVSHPLVGLPEIADLGTASRMNGMLRVEEDVYRIRDGKLYHLDYSGKEPVESGTASGVLGPGYLFQLKGGKVESLADQNRVLMKFKVEGDHNLGEHLILGLGASYVNKSGEKIQGGLINAKDLSQASLDVAMKVDQSRTNSLEKRNWFDNALSSTVTAGFDTETADKVSNSKDLAIMRASKINDLFRHGFDTNNISAPQFDAQNKDILHLMKDCNLSAETAEDLIKKHEITNTLIREGIITGAATMVSVAATAATDGAAAPIAATNLARGSELISLARSLGASSAAVGSLNTVLRFKEGKDIGETAKFASRNFGDGVLQGLAMKVPAAQIKEVGDIAKASNIGRVVAQTELFQAGQSLRETGSVIPDNAQEATGNIVAASALTMLTHGVSMQMEKFPFLGNAINDADTQLARCAQMRLNGGDAAVIEKLANQAMAKKEIVGYLLNATSAAGAAATYSGMPAIPEAVQIEKQRIEKTLGKGNLTATEFMQHMNLDNMSNYVIERAGIAALTAGLFSGNPLKASERPSGSESAKSTRDFFSDSPEKSNSPKELLMVNRRGGAEDNEKPSTRDSNEHSREPKDELSQARTHEILAELLLKPAPNLDDRIYQGARSALESIPLQDLESIAKSGFKLHTVKSSEDANKFLSEDSKQAPGVTLTDPPQIIIAEKGPGKRGRHFLDDHGFDPKKVTLHELGHAITHSLKLTENVELVDAYLKIAKNVAPKLVEEHKQLLTERQKLPFLGSEQLKKDYDRRLEELVEFSWYLRKGTGLHEVLADLYACSHGGSARFSKTLQRLHENFSGMQEMLDKNNWYREPLNEETRDG